MKIKEKDLLVTLIWISAALPFATISTLENSILRTIIGIPIVLFIPGYLLTTVLFPKRYDLEIVGRIALSFGLSIVVVSFLGLILNFTLGLKLFPMIIILYVYAITMILFTIYRREKLPENERTSISFHKIIGDISPKNRMDGVLTGILIFTIILAIGMSYMAIVVPKVGEAFTEFYILDDSGKTGNYSTNLKIDNIATYMIGVTNHEYDTTNYRIDVVVGQDLLTSRYLILNRDEIWEDNVTFMLDKEGTNMKLEFLLFKNDLTEPYRKLYLKVDAEK